MKVALIGLGMVARTHVRAITASAGHVILKGVCSQNPKKAAEFAQSIAVDLGAPPQVYATVQDIAADPDIDFAVLCTPPNARAEIVATLASAGKHILMEKPIERSFDAAAAIVSTCEAAGVTLGIVFQHRMRASAQQLTSLLNSGTLGGIAVVEINVPWWRAQSYYDEPGRGTYARDGGGVLISQAIHTLDLALSLTGPVTKVQAIARTSSLHRMEAENYVSAGLDFANGAVGSLIASTTSYPGGAESITLHCKNGSAVMKSGQLEVFWQTGKVEKFGEESASGGGADPMAFTHEWHQAIIEDFATSLAENRAPVVSGRTALDVHRLIDAIVLSSEQERAISLSVSK